MRNRRSFKAGISMTQAICNLHSELNVASAAPLDCPSTGVVDGVENSKFADDIRNQYLDEVVSTYDRYIAAMDWAERHGLPKLIGSQKQLIHAELLRQWMLETHIAVDVVKLPPASAEILSRLRAEVRSAWWIRLCGFYVFSRYRGTDRQVCDGFSRTEFPLAQRSHALISGRIMEVDQEFSQRETNRRIVDDDVQLRSVEKAYGLRGLQATSPAQRLYARKIRARAVFDGADLEAMKALKSASKIIDFYKGRLPNFRLPNSAR